MIDDVMIHLIITIIYDIDRQAQYINEWQAQYINEWQAQYLGAATYFGHMMHQNVL